MACGDFKRLGHLCESVTVMSHAEVQPRVVAQDVGVVGVGGKSPFIHGPRRRRNHDAPPRGRMRSCRGSRPGWGRRPAPACTTAPQHHACLPREAGRPKMGAAEPATLALHAALLVSAVAAGLAVERVEPVVGRARPSGGTTQKRKDPDQGCLWSGFSSGAASENRTRDLRITRETEWGRVVSSGSFRGRSPLDRLSSAPLPGSCLLFR